MQAVLYRTKTQAALPFVMLWAVSHYTVCCTVCTTFLLPNAKTWVVGWVLCITTAKSHFEDLAEQRVRVSEIESLLIFSRSEFMASRVHRVAMWVGWISWGLASILSAVPNTVWRTWRLGLLAGDVYQTGRSLG